MDANQNQAHKRARYDLAMEAANQAYSQIQSSRNNNTKIPHLIAAYVMLEMAMHALGEDLIKTELDDMPEIRSLIAQAQTEFQARLSALENLTANLPDNVIYHDFKTTT